MTSYSGEMYTIVEDAIAELKEWAKDNPGYAPGDQISEIADSSVPNYVSDLMQLAVDNYWLATTVPDFETDGTAHGVLQAVVREAVEEALREAWNEIQDEIDEEEESEEEETEEDVDPEVVANNGDDK